MTPNDVKQRLTLLIILTSAKICVNKTDMQRKCLTNFKYNIQ